MHYIKARNVNDAVAQAIPYLLEHGVTETSRNGAVLVAPGPVLTEYTHPCERVLFSETRDANPFFHMAGEALWMIAGRNDLAYPMYFNKRFAEYSDDGARVHGAYGNRWRNWFGMDQLNSIAKELGENPHSRRAVLSMWSAVGDLSEAYAGRPETQESQVVGGLKSRDIPCNTHAYFDLRGGALNMTVCNRSNDAIWGAYGANAVHFSFLQEYMAAWLSAPVGVYRQFSNNLHIYTDVHSVAKLEKIAEESALTNFYTLPSENSHHAAPFPIISIPVDEWNNDLIRFMDGTFEGLIDPFFNYVAVPMFKAWEERKEKRGDGLGWTSNIVASDWRMACLQWIARRTKKN